MTSGREGGKGRRGRERGRGEKEDGREGRGKREGGVEGVRRGSKKSLKSGCSHEKAMTASRRPK